MTSDDKAYIEAERRHVHHLMAWSVAWLIGMALSFWRGHGRRAVAGYLVGFALAPATPTIRRRAFTWQGNLRESAALRRGRGFLAGDSPANV